MAIAFGNRQNRVQLWLAADPEHVHAHVEHVAGIRLPGDDGFGQGLQGEIPQLRAGLEGKFVDVIPQRW